MNLRELADLHREMSSAWAIKPRDALLLWYADHSVEVKGDSVSYQCSNCGTSLNNTVEEFVERSTREELKCKRCLGDPGQWGIAQD